MPVLLLLCQREVEEGFVKQMDRFKKSFTEEKEELLYQREELENRLQEV